MEYARRKIFYKAKTSWSSIAFMVESILLLLFLVISIAVLTKTFAASIITSMEGRSLDAATIAATGVAEQFTANPETVEGNTKIGDMLVVCDVEKEVHDAGTLYVANISVYDTSSLGTGEALYNLTTSRYESDAS